MSKARSASPVRSTTEKRAKSPARSTKSSTSRERSTSPPRSRSRPRAASAAELSETEKPSAVTPAESSAEFRKSVLVYVVCVGTLAIGLTGLIAIAPPVGEGECDGATAAALLAASPQQRVVSLWRCAVAYQRANWWFVVCFFELIYIGLKMFAIPLGFTLGILAGPLGLPPLRPPDASAAAAAGHTDDAG